MATQKLLSPAQQVQQHFLRMKLQALGRVVQPEPLRAPPLPLIRVSPYVAFPAAGAGPLTLVSFTVPAGLNALLQYLSIFAAGGSNYVDGAATVIWRVLIDDTGVKGMEALQGQFGSSSLPLPVAIPLIENSTFKVTVEVPNGQVAPTGTTGVRFHASQARAAIAALTGIGTNTTSTGSGAGAGSPGSGGAGGGSSIPPVFGGGAGGGGGRGGLQP
ncbi:MAG TPA: hypothetical protein VIJ01_16725 [Candidatus Angelobacter sp.]